MEPEDLMPNIQGLSNNPYPELNQPKFLVLRSKSSVEFRGPVRTKMVFTV